MRTPSLTEASQSSLRFYFGLKDASGLLVSAPMRSIWFCHSEIMQIGLHLIEYVDRQAICR